VSKYAITADEYNWKVVEIKIKGDESKTPGEEYDVPLAYFKNLESAAKFIVNRDSKMNAQIMPLIEAFKAAELAAINAVKEYCHAISNRTDEPVQEAAQPT
jgi:Ser-tRNA(Ala) deacylase AlaX